MTANLPPTTQSYFRYAGLTHLFERSILDRPDELLERVGVLTSFGDMGILAALVHCRRDVSGPFFTS